ncbi:centrosome and spindle pole associated protein 1-like isoform X4 [Hypomesus transpacificus]|uniref:centrosome and spindle pole associated protein 1-like isoform X4 n=1 Tax=Hypomesus transpacificus TaxID=137520 RepID=UPI001F074EE5|nr:centrosome and spindle pole associated protein 1-like isoform X4 [Hypomesus transpacificus]
MDDDLENFLKEQRAKVAEDKANLKHDPPYMEIRAKHHKAYDQTIKENIPPFKRSTVLAKEEGQSLSLSLGEDYERKKQKLQEELRQDYRRYMAQEHGASLRPPPVLDVQPGPRPPSRRDAATLTEGRRGVHIGRHLAEVRGPWAEEDGLPFRESRTTRLGRVEPGDEDSEDDYVEDELELMERRRLEAIQSERRRPRHYYKADSRSRDRRKEPHGEYIDTGHHGQRTSHENRQRKEADGSVVQEGYQDRTSSLTNQVKLQSTGDTSSNPTSKSAINKNEFATGLMIGAADADVVSQRRKERYRQELQEQIAEQQRNKKREKDLELRVTSTGATEPEKLPDRIKHFGQSIGKKREDLYRAGLGLDEAPAGEEPRRPPADEKHSVDRERERLPPELPIVAFQSPLLEYSSALGLSNGGLSPYSQAMAVPRGMDSPRMPGIPLHPQNRMAEAYRSPYDEGYSYYGARNTLEPNLPYYGQMAIPGGVPLMSYLTLPQTGGGPPSHHSLHGTQHIYPEAPPPPLRPNSEAATVSSGISVFPGEKILPSKERALSYKEALKQQIQEKQERRRLEKEERDSTEARLEFHMKNHDPWGRGGCGAPLRDTRGNLITDLHQMHKQNEEAWLNPETWQKRAPGIVPVLREDLPSINTVSGFDRVQTPMYARGSVFANQPTPQQLMEKDKYKSFLKQQIEEKRLKEAEEREKLRLEEEKEERRLAEQRARIQWEYDEEQERKKRKEMEQKAKNEELACLAEERRKEAERKKKEADEKEMAALRMQYEEERQARVEEYDPHHTVYLQVHREPSPPIPTLQKRHRAPQYTPRPPTVDSRRSTAPMSECSLSGLQSQSPPVPARRNELRAAEDQRGVISELSALRRQLRSEQKRLEGQLMRSEWEELESPMSDRRREVDVFDMARLRLQAPVRRPPSRNMEPSKLLRIHDSLQFRYPDSDFRYGYGELPRDEGQPVDIQRQADQREQQRRRSSLRRKPGHDYFDLSPPQKPNHYSRDPGRGYLLESESAFINPMGDTYPVPRPPEQKPPQLSARERRRRAKNAESHNVISEDREASREPTRLPDDYILQSESAGRAQEHEHHSWTRRLLALRRRGRTTGDLSEDDDDDEESPGVSPRGPDRRSSADTDATEPWLRPESSETLKRLMTGPSRRERLPPLQGVHTQDWGGPSTYHG